MIPSLVVRELRTSLIEYLTTTFALSDHTARAALGEFFQRDGEGIFRGPFLRVRTPYRPAPDDRIRHLDWLPDGFHPYAHQATAFERLGAADGHRPESTIITTGTGSGKTECFLYPILDHCVRERAAGRAGLKALILYPMNALAGDQAKRLARLIAEDPRLHGIRAGMYVGEGDAKPTSTMTEDRIIDDRHALRSAPPDILLTNYKMLDYLLLRPDDAPLWDVGGAGTLSYVVLDEFHTYNAAQGTDVAMLLRRLGKRLGVSRPGAPLGEVATVGTSATLGSGDDADERLRSFAGTVFGGRFDDDSIVREQRQSIDETCGPIDYTLAVPEPGVVASLHDPDDLATVFRLDAGGLEDAAIDDDGIGTAKFDDVAARDAGLGEGTEPDDERPEAVRLGDWIIGHHLTRAVLSAAGRPQRWDRVVDEVVERTPSWGRARLEAPDTVDLALVKFLQLLSLARRDLGSGRTAPLLSVEMQLWVREVTRVLRGVATAPSFRWYDTPPVVDEDGPGERFRLDLPAVHCRECGMSGWRVLARDNSRSHVTDPHSIYAQALAHSPLVRDLLLASPADPGVRWFDPVDRMLHGDAGTPDDDESVLAPRVPVLVTETEDDARRERCPGCGTNDGIAFLGSRVPSLASVSINALFGSNHLDPGEQKLLAFTDSVQDASHRAAFLSSRTYRFTFRSLIAQALRHAEPMNVTDLAAAIEASAETERDRYRLVPPDLWRDPLVRTTWTASPEPEGQRRLRARLRFEVDLEVGLRARLGRTVELSRAAAAAVEFDDRHGALGLIGEEFERLTGERAADDTIETYVAGLLERMRLNGAISHPLLEPYLDDGGRPWHLWGGRPDGLPAFPTGRRRPRFVTTAQQSDAFDALGAAGNTPTWLVDWVRRSLGEAMAGWGALDGITAAVARDLNLFAFRTLAAETDAVVGRIVGGATIYGLDPRAVVVAEVADRAGSPDGATTPGRAEPLDSLVRCDVCGAVFAAPPPRLGSWAGRPCLRYRCPGRFALAPSEERHYYRRLYRDGAVASVRAAEHTSLVGRKRRERIESDFASGAPADAPNVLAATPTLEMGIDIGDLSAVMLTSVPPSPASYLQRVGRAGRHSGNAVVAAILPVNVSSLHYLDDPELLIDGTVRPPHSLLDAAEILRRQYFAFLLDRVADGRIEAPALPSRISAVAKAALDDGSTLRAVVDASTSTPSWVDEFIESFDTGRTDAPSSLAEPSRERLRDFADSGIEGWVKSGLDVWTERMDDLRRRIRRLAAAVDRVEARGDTVEGVAGDELREILSQRRSLIDLRKRLSAAYSLTTLEELGLLPNYGLIDDPVELQTSLWQREADGNFVTESALIQRGALGGFLDFAPGNSFYVDGHRHDIDTTDIGPQDEPHVETWRLCPDCSFAVPDDVGSITVCPRCGDPRIADTGALATMLRFRRSSASGSEEAARVSDDHDDRRRANYLSAELIDIAPSEVRGSWHHRGQSFGAEFVDAATIRRLNFGLRGNGVRRQISGWERIVPGFATCARCGAVRQARERFRRRDDDVHHPWCPSRSGREKEHWEDLILYHELVTEAVRFLLPFSLLGVEENSATFAATLTLGMREGLGIELDDLRLAPADLPNRGGQGRKRFLVAYQATPGGTGYLEQLADPDRIRLVLEAARKVLVSCRCTSEGRAACHRCLLGAGSFRDPAGASRSLALDLIEPLLADWKTTPCASLGDADVAEVEESELERRFRTAVRAWVDGTDGVTFTDVPGTEGGRAFELRFDADGFMARYRVEEQAGLGTTPSVLPDYLITRIDGRADDVAVFLDGYEFHASSRINHLAKDAGQRAGVRDSRRLVWNLTWDDVDQFHRAVDTDPPRLPPDRPLLGGPALSAAKHYQQGYGGAFDAGVVNLNPLALLLDFLSRPDRAQWRSVARAAAAGLMGAAAKGEPSTASTGTLSAEILDDALAHAADARAPRWLPAADTESEVIAAGAATTTASNLPITVLLDRRSGTDDGGRWTVLMALDDSAGAVDDSEGHRARWGDWLAWANVLQLLGSRDDVVIATRSMADDLDTAELWIGVGPSGTPDESTSDGAPSTPVATATENASTEAPPPVAAFTPEIDGDLDLMDPDTADLVRAVHRTLAANGDPPEMVAGLELDGLPVEAAWPSTRVGIVLDDDEPRSDDGWDLRRVSDWTVQELTTAIRSSLDLRDTDISASATTAAGAGAPPPGAASPVDPKGERWQS